MRLNLHLIALIGLGLAACTTPARVACAPPPGAEALWRNPETKYLVLGEIHGTTEMPAATAELACAAAMDGENVLLALELPEDHEPTLRRFIAGEIDAATMMRGSRFWEQGRDGRNSVAMLAMLERVRELRRAGLTIDIVGFFPTSELSAAKRERLIARLHVPEGVDGARSLHDIRMAARIVDASNERAARRTIVLIGNLHALTEPSQSSSLNSQTRIITPFIRMNTAAALPRAQTLSLNFTISGGSAFNQTADGPGMRSIGASETELTEPGVALDTTSDETPRYDGRIFLGQVTASPPAALN